MVTAITTVHLDSKTSFQKAHENPSISRAPLLPSEKNNNRVANGANSRRTRENPVASRYMSPSSSTTTTSTSSSTSSSYSSVPRRFPSPSISRTKDSNPTPKRCQSADRRRSVTHKRAPATNSSEVSAATKLLVTSTRSLSVSFQGEVFSLPISKTKPTTLSNTNSRKATPERRATPLRGKADGGVRDQVEISKPVDHHRGLVRNRQYNMLSRSLDVSNGERKELIGSGVVSRVLQDSLTDDGRLASFDGILNFDPVSADELSGIRGGPDGTSLNESSIPSDFTASDSESVSSGSTSGAQESNGVAPGRSGSRSFVTSARFWQETNMRLRRLQDSGSPLLTSPPSKMSAPPKLTQSRKFNDGPFSPRTMSSPIRGSVMSASPNKLMTNHISSPIRGSVRSASPNKLMTNNISSPLRGISPARLRSSVGGTLTANFYDTPSVLSYVVDVRRDKVGDNQIIDAHQLRLLYNRHLQWRLVNARADAAMLVQRCSAETSLWNAWITIAGLRDSVRHKRVQLQLLKQKLKLTSILSGQIAYLEQWSHLDDGHSSSLQAATEALKASTLRLPVVGGAAVDIQSVKEAIGSAVDVMHAMASSIYCLLTKVEEVYSSVTELVNIAGKERALLEQCKSFLSALSALQVEDCSLRTHVLQHNRLRMPGATSLN